MLLLIAYLMRISFGRMTMDTLLGRDSASVVQYGTINVVFGCSDETLVRMVSGVCTRMDVGGHEGERTTHF
jgi:hypothetical protein